LLYKESTCDEERDEWVLPVEYRDHKEFILTAVAKLDVLAGVFMEAISEDLRNDNDIVLSILAKAKYSINEKIQWVSTRLRDDTEVAKLAISQCGACWLFVSESLRQNRDLWLYAASIWRLFWWTAPECIKQDKEVVLAAIPCDESVIVRLRSQTVPATGL